MKDSGARRYLLLEDVAPYISIDYLFPGRPRGLPVRARIALESNGIRTIGDLLQWTRDELLDGINIGRSIVQEVDERLRSKLGVGVGEWNP